MAWEKGQKTRGTCLWLADDDIVTFSEALHATMPAMQWTCSHVGDDRMVGHDYATLRQALDCPLGENHAYVRQARTMLPLGVPKPLGMLQLNFDCAYPRTVIPERDFGPATDKSVYPAEFLTVTDSSLSIRWNTQDGDEATCAAMDAQVKQVWKVLNSVTKPVKCHGLINGIAISTPRYRIGAHMLDMAKHEGWTIQQGLFFVLD